MKRFCFFNSLLMASVAFASLMSCSDVDDMNTAGSFSSKQHLSATRANVQEQSVLGSNFASSTPYRLVAFSSSYDEKSGAIGSDKAFRFNLLAKDAMMGTTHYISVDGKNESQLFGFVPYSEEEKQETATLRSIDFYGFTLGEAEASADDSYLALDDNDTKSLDGMKKTVAIGTDNHLPDLMYGQLLGRHIANESVRSEIPFKHCFSKLIFEASQMEDPNEAGKRKYDIAIEEIKVTGTYNSGSVALGDGKVTLNGENVSRVLPDMVAYQKGGTVSLTKDSLGQMLLFPTMGGANGSITNDSYTLGLEVKIKSSKEADVKRFVTKMGNGSTMEPTVGADGLWHGTLIVQKITSTPVNSTDEPGDPLYLKSNTAYTIHLTFMNDKMRILTVIPMVEEWIPAEEEEVEIGQPSFFGNIQWADRNLGADTWNPDGVNADGTINFYRTIGYFYQSFRNIPYWPLNTTEWQKKGYGEDVLPDFNDKSVKAWAYKTDDFYKGTWNITYNHGFPVVDINLLKKSKIPVLNTDKNTSNTYWTIKGNSMATVLTDVTEKNVNKESSFAYLYTEISYDRKAWWEGSQNQPVPAGWEIPSVEQFKAIFPSNKTVGDINLYGKGNAHLDPTKVADDPSTGYKSVYIIDDKMVRIDKSRVIDGKTINYVTDAWGIIYAIKKQGTPEAYRMKWEVVNKGTWQIPRLTLRVSMYSCSADATLVYDDKGKYKEDFKNPTSVLYFPLSGMMDGASSSNGGKSKIGSYYNCGTEAVYATSDQNYDPENSNVLWIKITGDEPSNLGIRFRPCSFAHGKQIRLIRSKK